MAKKLFIAVLIVIAIPLIVGLFVPSNFKVQQTTIVNKPVDEVFEFISHLKNHKKFTYWSSLDSLMEKEYIGEDGTVGFTYKWDSKEEKIGKGEQKIVALEKNKRVDFALHFYVPFEAENTSFMTTEPTENGNTILGWGFDGSVPYPMNVLLLFSDMDKELGKQLQEGLLNVKTVLESEDDLIF